MALEEEHLDNRGPVVYDESMTTTTEFTEADRAMACALGAQVALDRFARLAIGPGNAKGRVPFFIDETKRTEGETMWFAMMDKITRERPTIAECVARGWMFRKPE